jgi:hypothetical protein
MRIDKHYGVTITIYKGQKFLGKHFDGFRNLSDIRGFVWSEYKGYGNVNVYYCQGEQGDYMNIRTQKKEVWRGL